MTLNTSSVKKNNEFQVLIFDLGKHPFAINVNDLVAVTRLLEITPIARTADFFEGLINLRGQLTPVINLRLLFMSPPKEPDNETRLLAVKGEGVNFCLVVDKLEGFMNFSPENLESPPEILQNRFIETVYKTEEKLISVLNTKKLVNADEIKQFIASRSDLSLVVPQESLQNQNVSSNDKGQNG